MLEVVICAGLTAILALAGLSMYQEQSKATNKISQANSFDQYLYTFQKKLSRIEHAGTPLERKICGEALNGVLISNPANIDNENPVSLNIPNVMESIGVVLADDGKYHHSEYEIHRIKLYGDASGLEEIDTEGLNKTYEGYIVIEFKKNNQITMSSPFEIYLNVNEFNLVDSCSPLLFSTGAQGFTSDICKRMLGDDFTEFDPATGECLVPVYTDIDCNNNQADCASILATAKSNSSTVGGNARLDPIDGKAVKLKDVICDLTVRGSVTGKLYCNPTP